MRYPALVIFEGFFPCASLRLLLRFFMVYFRILKLNKTPCYSTYGENLQEVFLMLIVVVILPHWRFFISFHLLSDVIPHPSASYHRVFTPILYFQISLLQNDSRQFHFTFSGLFILPRVLRFS